MKVSFADCIYSKNNELINYKTNTTYNETEAQGVSQVIRFLAFFAPPYITSRQNAYKVDEVPVDVVCGPLMKLVRELSIKHDYR